MELKLEDVDDLCTGAAFLGAGGGGDPYIGGLMVKEELMAGRRIEILDPDHLPDDDLVIPTAMMGAPTVLLEKIPSGEEPILALRAVEAALGRKAAATMPTEVGGINSTIPLFVGARLGVPVVDADGQGRAFPELQMETFAIEGVAGTPLGIADEKGDFATIRTEDNHRMEWIARGITIRMGGTAYFANYPMSGAEVKRASVKHTLSLARSIGRIIRTSRREKHDPFEELEAFIATTSYGRAKRIFSGKVVDLDRQTSRGFTLGAVTIAPDSGTGAHCTITFQNENLCAKADGALLAVVPDIITVLDAETAVPITNETLRYGQRVAVVAVGVPPIMRTPAALKQFGPEAFGLEEAYVPLAG
ncbi:DUF917 domain-containing protein [Psychromarinibacter sp. C21-152]|uniref:DUF917 domain-containing protein n=1 Tax=Psychromarinibacter sediminicola TaxID=3033385 RepID=A0AAE3NVU3_9RHOB|nr:DUF917 domain-containing protein [Psychromarinibacter sediminicola]MDF0603216.1 DUF917 domain-containing protein [Psychromarinibacter sediminicola]